MVDLIRSLDDDSHRRHCRQVLIILYAIATSSILAAIMLCSKQSAQFYNSFSALCSVEVPLIITVLNSIPLER